MSKSEQGLMGKTAAAAYISLSERGLDLAVSRGEVVPVLVGKRPVFRKGDLDEFNRSRRPHRLPADFDYSQFETAHSENGRRRGLSYTVGTTGNSKTVEVTQERLDILAKLFADAGLAWNGESLSVASARDLLTRLKWLTEVVELLKRGHGLDVRTHRN